MMFLWRFVCGVLVWGTMSPAVAAVTGVCSSSVKVDVRGVKGALCTLQQYLTARADQGLVALQAVERSINETQEYVTRMADRVDDAASELQIIREQSSLGLDMMREFKRDIMELKQMVADLYNHIDAVPPGSCPDGYTAVADTCYLMSSSALMAVEAPVFCQGHGGHVVSVTSDAELEKLQKFLHDQRVTVNVPSLAELASSEMFPYIQNGTRVVRGKDWDWGSQDGPDGNPGLGTVVKVTTPDKWLTVMWDNGHSNGYRMGHELKYDLQIAFTESLYLVWMDCQRIEGTWKEGEGLEEITYFKWMQGQPDNAADEEDCLQLGYSPSDQSLLMNDYTCNALSHVVCQA